MGAVSEEQAPVSAEKRIRGGKEGGREEAAIYLPLFAQGRGKRLIPFSTVNSVGLFYCIRLDVSVINVCVLIFSVLAISLSCVVHGSGWRLHPYAIAAVTTMLC